MIAGVADTHAGLWYVFGDSRLSSAAKSAFEVAAQTRRKIAMSAITLAEIVYLVEKGRVRASAYDDLQEALHDPKHVLQETPLTSEITDAMRLVARADIPDMPDRIVAATAVYFGVPVISRDGASGRQTFGQSGNCGRRVRAAILLGGG
jgi:PIN domain nuclease of toxin-antitoxin system